ncbi:hypothetical protein N7492_007453 [Penicillium capsulatum]|uniref:Uncharacterized protein n=1 Tax=Penicillium capsulatum TaxID=69766 RepID=A0A9W9LM30_9EURO|nr:hypothetical protein N7492_007453 [Penicillium capsulatum]KAJ6117286.1 hypothetical protein N7512_007011 [Penicillium capsulatum]
MSSNSSAAGSHPSSWDYRESNFLQRNRVLHWVRLGLSALISAVSIAAIACEAVPYQHYRDTVRWAWTGLALWPLNFDIRPTVVALACASIVAFLNLTYMTVALLPSPHSRIKVLNIGASISALAGSTTTLVGILLIIYRPVSSYPDGFTYNETLHSWTCRWRASGDIPSPLYFTRDCQSTRAGFTLLCTALGLEILMGLAAAAGAWFQRDVGRRREEQLQLEKLDVATKQVYRP